MVYWELAVDVLWLSSLEVYPSPGLPHICRWYVVQQQEQMKSLKNGSPFPPASAWGQHRPRCPSTVTGLWSSTMRFSLVLGRITAVRLWAPMTCRWPSKPPSSVIPWGYCPPRSAQYQGSKSPHCYWLPVAEVDLWTKTIATSHSDGGWDRSCNNWAACLSVVWGGILETLSWTWHVESA
jgi:hypothetical protein